jgi:hypothetical protein
MPKKISKTAQYGDRFSLTVKEFGREVIIRVNRGTAECSEDGKLVTITYDDSPIRNKKLGA